MGKPVTMDELAELRAGVSGVVYARGDAGLAHEARCFNTAIVHDPDVVVGARGADDIIAAVAFAARHRLPVFVQATGHGAFAPITEGVLISTRRMGGVSVDPELRMATIGAGARWGAVVDRASRYGLTPITGSSSHVGAVGYTLGGGLGPLARTYGFTADWVRGFTVVTADGRLVRASATEHPDLFWALRGGKGGLGLVVDMDLELVPLKRVYGGGLFYDSEHIEDALRAWVDWVHSLPDTVTSSVALLRFPPIDEVPENLRGRFALHLRFAFIGDERDGERLLAPMRRAAPAFLDLIGDMSTTEIDSIHDDRDQAGPAWDRGMQLTDIDQAFVTALLSRAGAGSDVPFIAIEIRHIGAGATRGASQDTAIGGAGSPFTLVMIGVPVPELFDSVLPQSSDYIVSGILPWIADETNINFLGHVASTQQFASAWPADAFSRLIETRTAWDPEGLFAYPAGPAGGIDG
ncbi:FAD-binding oxidoreductase [Amnibacterium flavum]|uniref:FAD-binding protein n=1 Tax=Amnibacterium flavum TaxID=2173173 RepID=A0A2V1HSI4_9MICO|nr:FAD-dependent oxidoreductase [Amnibacterium flavum]PVZ95528.1 FAD-binding protein [Amnibacterium flavum]